jgi:hypothetical protein
LPACHGCARSQRSVAWPSSRSSNGAELAAGPERPARGLDEHLQAALGQQAPEQQAGVPRRPYGERTSTVGAGEPPGGAHRSA